MHKALVAAAAVSLTACGLSPNREVQGTLAGMSTQQALVLSETTEGQVAVAQVSPKNGSFVVEVPTNRPTRLVIAHADASGTAVADRHIGPAWFTVVEGGRLDLGVIRPSGVERPAVDPVSGAVHQCPGTTTTTTTTTPPPGNADLPYDVKLSVGDSFKLTDAFLEKGPLPAAVLNVTMDGASWRLTELQANTAFTVTAADCSHAGNRDVGRDRVFVTWQNADGSKQTDHLDLRYCESGSVSQPLEDSSAGDSASVDVEDGVCESVEVSGCGEAETTCDHSDALEPATGSGVCGGATPAPGPTGPIN